MDSPVNTEAPYNPSHQWLSRATAIYEAERTAQRLHQISWRVRQAYQAALNYWGDQPTVTINRLKQEVRDGWYGVNYETHHTGDDQISYWAARTMMCCIDPVYVDIPAYNQALSCYEKSLLNNEQSTDEENEHVITQI